MEIYPFHHKNLFFNIITDYDLTFKELREILDYLLEKDGFQDEGDPSRGGRMYEIRLGNVRYAVDVHGYEVVIYRRTEMGGSKKRTMAKFVHPELKQRVDFFGGGYLFVEEGKLNYRGKEVLYFVGMAQVESSCCGTGGSAFIRVPGFLISWKKTRDEMGRPISEVERIAGAEAQKEIRKLLEEKHPGFLQIEFL